MTPKQEQIVLIMLASIADVPLADVPDTTGRVQCQFCGACPQYAAFTSQLYEHKSSCLVLLARELQKTLEKGQ